MSVKLIAHALMKKEHRYLVLKRSSIKRGKANVYPNYWDIPGGGVELHELPQAAALRETLEEANQVITITGILHEDSQFDSDKQTVFTRLVYATHLKEKRPIELDPEEHTDFRWIKSLEELEGEQIVPYLYDLIPTAPRKGQYSELNKGEDSVKSL
ncbi:NUDIX domain-containing protein [Streptococcus sp. zg-86]|uniref:NUDIX domain-containing protein n=1 Tax=Streptococcus zhangguiae TaxID=2664091 RepID=A0A6I4RG08_9STRE|nr:MULTISPECIES: NUDIX domain-containing protein [unclassified Streptococcus]MTB64371.1 NUDIX domain-containing protein [Streptococcus sp. zg-86]MTB90681.1 NUDIX domain-containing protein [Streptococcus sp. zg-36]MWV56324.1 NUDIX domain-containing protein [Streptococcus sp. zg-70]QTH47463.1 NUDIX domain-containing protein [Streptococcus sp. zg-86]